MGGYAGNIDWVYLDQSTGHGPKTDDLVSVEAGGMPIYRVMAIRDGRVWLRDQQDGSDRVMPPSEFHWKAITSAAHDLR